MITSLETHIAAAVLMAFTCVALGWMLRGWLDRGRRDLDALTDLDTEHWVDQLTQPDPPPGEWNAWELAHLHPEREVVASGDLDVMMFAADMAARTDRFIEAIRAER